MDNDRVDASGTSAPYPDLPGSLGMMPVSRDRMLVLARYVLAILCANLIWEVAQLPLYTIWWDGTSSRIAFAALHCTLGDLVIAALSLLAAVVFAGGRHWPHRRFARVAGTAVAIGLAYTLISEWLNTDIRGSWAYTAWMPRLPLIGTGLAPLAQWLVVPPLALLWARRVIPSGRGALDGRPPA